MALLPSAEMAHQAVGAVGVLAGVPVAHAELKVEELGVRSGEQAEPVLLTVHVQVRPHGAVHEDLVRAFVVRPVRRIRRSVAAVLVIGVRRVERAAVRVGSRRFRPCSTRRAERASGISKLPCRERRGRAVERSCSPDHGGSPPRRRRPSRGRCASRPSRGRDRRAASGPAGSAGGTRWWRSSDPLVLQARRDFRTLQRFRPSGSAATAKPCVCVTCNATGKSEFGVARRKKVEGRQRHRLGEWVRPVQRGVDLKERRLLDVVGPGDLRRDTDGVLEHRARRIDRDRRAAGRPRLTWAAPAIGQPLPWWRGSRAAAAARSSALHGQAVVHPEQFCRSGPPVMPVQIIGMGSCCANFGTVAPSISTSSADGAPTAEVTLVTSPSLVVEPEPTH